jgi:hypothetical protein
MRSITDLGKGSELPRRSIDYRVPREPVTSSAAKPYKNPIKSIFNIPIEELRQICRTNDGKFPTVTFCILKINAPFVYKLES